MKIKNIIYLIIITFWLLFFNNQFVFWQENNNDNTNTNSDWKIVLDEDLDDDEDKDNKDDKTTKKCEEWDENCEEEKKEVELPDEVKQLYQLIENKYWQNPKNCLAKENEKKCETYMIDWDNHYIKNDSMYFALSWIKDLKDWVKNIDNNVKLDYMMSKMMSFNIWNWMNLDEWWLSNFDSLYSYTTYWYYVKANNIIWRMLSSTPDALSRLQTNFNNNSRFIKFLLDNWFWSSIWRNESATSFSWWQNTSYTIHESARNWWFFQIYNWCDVIWWNSLERNTWKPIYVSWETIWWLWMVYWWSADYHRWPQKLDISCASKLWKNIDWIKMTAWSYAQLWTKFKQADQERYNYIKTTLSLSEEDTLVYLWKELQYMYQFYNFVNFLCNKLWFSYSSSSTNAYQWSRWWFSKILEQYNIKNYTLEDYKADLEKVNAFNAWNKWIKFQWYEKNKTEFRKLWITSEIWYKDIIMIHYYWLAWTLYNWTWNVWNYYIDNPYVSNIRASRASPTLFWKTVTMWTCQIKTDWWSAVCNRWSWSLWIWISYMLYVKNVLWWSTNSDFLNYLQTLINWWKFTKITWIKIE